VVGSPTRRSRLSRVPGIEGRAGPGVLPPLRSGASPPLRSDDIRAFGKDSEGEGKAASWSKGCEARSVGFCGVSRGVSRVSSTGLWRSARGASEGVVFGCSGGVWS
jgi:hypothetical protein